MLWVKKRRVSLNERNTEKSFIYAIGTDTKQKIGFSKNPKKRKEQLQTGNSENLSIHATIEVLSENAALLEKHLHKDIAYKRLKGEWFGMTKTEVVDYFEYVKIRWADEQDKLKYKI